MLCPSNGNIHSSKITYETQGPLLIWSDTWKDYNILLPTLESVHGVYFNIILRLLHTNPLTEQSENFVFQGSNLTFVGRNYSDGTLQYFHHFLTGLFCVWIHSFLESVAQIKWVFKFDLFFGKEVDKLFDKLLDKVYLILVDLGGFTWVFLRIQ